MLTAHEMDKPQAYQIKVQGCVDQSWSDWFNGMAISVEIDQEGGAITTLSGFVLDQAALRGILAKLWNLNMPLISVKLITSSDA